MNWPLLFRELCEGYMGLNPLVIEQMHPDQVFVLACDKEWLKTGKRTITGTPRELAAKGYIDALPEMSAVQMIRKKMKEEREQKEAKAKRRDARKQRRDDIKKADK